MADNFDWSADGVKLVVASVSAVAVYRNEAGDVVIRQESRLDGEDDPAVIIPMTLVPILIRTLEAEMDAGS